MTDREGSSASTSLEALADVIQQAIAGGFEALDIDRRIEEALDRRGAQSGSGTVSVSNVVTAPSSVRMGVIPSAGALQGVSVALGTSSNTIVP